MNSKEIMFLSKAYKTENDARLKEKILIVKLHYQGKTQRDISYELEISLGKVNMWIKRYEKEGISGLKNKFRSGRPPKISNTILRSISNRLKAPRSEKGIMRAGWNTKEVKELIEKESNIKYTPRHVRRILKKVGFSLITPRVNHIKKNKEAQDKFRREFKKNFKKNIWIIQS